MLFRLRLYFLFMNLYHENTNREETLDLRKLKNQGKCAMTRKISDQPEDYRRQVYFKQQLYC